MEHNLEESKKILKKARTNHIWHIRRDREQTKKDLAEVTLLWETIETKVSGDNSNE